MINLVLLNLNLGDIDGITLCEQLRNEFSFMKIVIVTSTNDGPIVLKAIKSGADGYILKTSGLNELTLAIKRVMQGETYICKEANAAMITALQSESIEPNKIASLTRREKEILKLLFKGFTSQEIAGQLSISVYTIDTHRKNMLQKFNVHNTQGLLHFVNQHNLLQ
jgi:DNA-binding NarL/FixJ family response regulator